MLLAGDRVRSRTHQHCTFWSSSVFIRRQSEVTTGPSCPQKTWELGAEWYVQGRAWAGWHGPSGKEGLVLCENGCSADHGATPWSHHYRCESWNQTFQSHALWRRQWIWPPVFTQCLVQHCPPRCSFPYSPQAWPVCCPQAYKGHLRQSPCFKSGNFRRRGLIQNVIQSLSSLTYLELISSLQDNFKYITESSLPRFTSSHFAPFAMSFLFSLSTCIRTHTHVYVDKYFFLNHLKVVNIMSF